MNVGLVLITHNHIGEQLKSAAASILKKELPSVTVVSVPADIEPEALGKYADRVKQSITDKNSIDGVLVLTDIHGATPNNLARYFSAESNARVVSGVNLPMLLRVLNYSQQSLETLCETAVTGGKTGVKQDQE
jgi:PTS system mannose-specific IIA component